MIALTASLRPRAAARALALLVVAAAAALPASAPAATTLPFTGSLDLNDPANAPALKSDQPTALTGTAVASVGDFDGDGRRDIAIGEPGRAANDRAGGGVVRVVSTSAGSGALDAAHTVTILGAAAGEAAGTALAAAGDVNGDGRADLLIGAPGGTGAGAAYLVFGRAGAGTIDLATDPDVVRVTGAGDGSRFGAAVATVADLNGDHVPELVVGAPKHEVGDRGRAGAVYIIYGAKAGATIAADGLAERGAGWRLDGPRAGGAAGALFGQSVASVDDLNGDGRPELIVGAPRAGAASATAEGNGMAYVIWGRPDAAATDVDALGAGGFTIARGGKRGADTPSGWSGDWLGGSVASVGDVNGDKVPDLAVGAQLADAPSRPNAGAAFVVYGRKASTPVDVEALDKTSGYRIDGVATNDYTGTVVGGAGDINADGKPDVLIAAPFASPSDRARAGAVYVVFGGTAPSEPLDLAEFGAKALRVVGAAESDTTGSSVVGAGDLDGDKGDDLLVGAPRLGEDFLLSQRTVGPGAVRIVPGATPVGAGDGTATAGPAAVVADPGYAEALKAGCRMATNVEALIEDNSYTDGRADPARIRRDALEAYIDDPRNADTVLGVSGDTPIFEPTVLGPLTSPKLGTTLHDAVDGEDNFPGYATLIESLGVVNPASQARIILVDGVEFGELVDEPGLTDGNPPTYVIAVGRPPERNAGDIRELNRLARETKGGLYRAENPREIERAFQKIESRLRCDVETETGFDEIYPGEPEVLTEDEVDDDAETADVEVNWRDPDAGFEIEDVDVIDDEHQVVRHIDAAEIQDTYNLKARETRKALVVGGRGQTFRTLHIRKVRAGTHIRVTVRAQKGTRGGRVYGRITQSRMRR